MTPPPGECFDTGIGRSRAVVKPHAGELVITEWMPDPSAVTDTNGEWFELRANVALDLNGLQAGSAVLAAAPIIAETGNCVRLDAGAYALFARNASSSANGMLPVTDGVFAFTLAQSNGDLRIGIDSTTLDVKTWTASAVGTSIMVDSDGTQCNAPTGVPMYNGSDIGTPKGTNTPPECP